MRALSRVILGLSFVAIAGAGCGKGPSEDQCKRALDKIVSIQADDAGAKATTEEAKAELAKQKQKVADNVRASFMADCKKKMPKGKIECVLKAKDKADLEKCDTGN